MAKKIKYFKCTLCDDNKERFKTLDGLCNHLDKVHQDEKPKNFTTEQFAYFLRTGKTEGSCIVCRKPTKWNESTGKYHRFCDNPKCKEKYRETFKTRMIGKYGKVSLLDDPEQQKKMLANRKISGKYKWSDGKEVPYTGTYELDFLKMLDVLLEYESKDVMSPSPHTYYYTYEGKKHFYIPDFFIPSLNLEIEIKDGGDNSNQHPKIQAVDKVKEKLKDEVMTSQNEFSYVKITNKEYNTFFNFLLELKSQYQASKGNKDEMTPIFLIGESATEIELVEEPVTENLIFNRNDLYYNLEKFESGKSNVLLITGFSGSGKSTLANQLSSKYKCNYFELDALSFYLNKQASVEDLKNGEPALVDFINKKKLEESVPKKSDYMKLYEEYLQFLVNWCKKRKPDKYIIEGLQIYEIFDEKSPQSFITSNPFIIKGTSALVSAIRGAKRNDGHFLKEFKGLLAWAIRDNKELTELEKSLTESLILSPDETEEIKKDFDKINIVKDIKKSNLQETTSLRVDKDVDSGAKFVNINKLDEKPYGIGNLKVAIESDPYLASDYHLNEGNLSSYISVINKTVGEEDHLIILGDLDDHVNPNIDLLKEFVERVNCKNIHLILGNNDSFLVEEYRNIGFLSVTDIYDYKNLVFSHYPVEVEGDTINIHGHLHERTEYKKVNKTGHINVFNSRGVPIKLSLLLNEYEKSNGFVLADTLFTSSVKEGYYSEIDIEMQELVPKVIETLEYMVKDNTENFDFNVEQDNGGYLFADYREVDDETILYIVDLLNDALSETKFKVAIRYKENNSGKLILYYPEERVKEVDQVVDELLMSMNKLQ